MPEIDGFEATAAIRRDEEVDRARLADPPHGPPALRAQEAERSHHSPALRV